MERKGGRSEEEGMFYWKPGSPPSMLTEEEEKMFRRLT